MVCPINRCANRCLTLNGAFAILLSLCGSIAALQKKEETMEKCVRSLFAGALVLGAVGFSGTAAAKLGSCNDPIVMGTTLSETGPFSTLADKWRKLTEVFAEEVNKTGGVMVKACNKKVPIK